MDNVLSQFIQNLPHFISL